MEAPRVALGVILGAAVGLLSLSCFILWTRATVLYFIAFSFGVSTSWYSRDVGRRPFDINFEVRH
jgi:uncharacterized membrane protein YbhN (UPF0104 family)